VWGVESEGVEEGVGSTVPTKIDTKSLTLPHELYASVVSTSLSARPSAPHAQGRRGAAGWRSGPGRPGCVGHWRRGPHAGGTATGPTGGVALIAIGAAAIPMYVDVCIIPRRVYTRRRNTGAPALPFPVSR